MNVLNHIPVSLIILRFLLGPILLVGYYYDASNSWYIWILSLGFLSDVFDGVIARKLGVASDKLRSLDSWADTVFYISVFLVSWAIYSYKLIEFIYPIMLLFGLEIIRHIYDKKKFGKSSSYHMWSAKLWGVFLFAGFIQLLGFSEAGNLFALAIVTGIITDIEGLIASVILTSWKADVPSLYHAYKIENDCYKGVQR